MFSDTKKLYSNIVPINKERVESAVKELYRYCNSCSYLPDEFYRSKPRPSRDPEVIFVDGPDELKEVMDVDEESFHAESFNSIAHFVNKRGWGPKERMHSVIANVFSFPSNQKRRGFINRWESPMMLAIDYLYDDGSDEHQSKYPNQWEDIAKKVWDNSYLVFTFINKCYVVNRPNQVSFNERGFHHKKAPSLTFRDGSKIYCHEGIQVDEKHFLNPKSMTLKDIHQHNSRKHYLIDMVGVEHYLELVKAWEPPETKGRWSKFFSFAKMVLPGDDLPDEKDARGFTKYRERGYGYHSYKDRPYEVRICYSKINGEYGLTFSSHDGREVSHFPDDVFGTEEGARLFDDGDRELWDLFDLRETFNRGPLELILSYQNKEFRLRSKKMYEGHRVCRHDVAPAWFKAKMFRGEDALYENEEMGYAIAFEDGKLMYAGDIEQGGSCIPKDEPRKPLKARGSLFGGCENLPSYQFDIDLVSGSWEGLLEKWARLGFEWLGLHEDSTRMP